MKMIAKGAAVLLVIISAFFSGAAQDKLRRVEQPDKFIYPETPIQVGVSMDGKQLLNREVKAGPDWLRKISLDVSNISGKDINWILINLVLKEGKPGITVPSPETAGIAITVELSYSEPTIKLLKAGARVPLKPPDNVVDTWTKNAGQPRIKSCHK